MEHMVNMLKLQVISNISVCVNSKNPTLMEIGPEDFGGGDMCWCHRYFTFRYFIREKKRAIHYLSTVYFK